jgi:hypothetical protein
MSPHCPVRRDPRLRLLQPAVGVALDDVATPTARAVPGSPLRRAASRQQPAAPSPWTEPARLPSFQPCGPGPVQPCHRLGPARHARSKTARATRVAFLAAVKRKKVAVRTVPLQARHRRKRQQRSRMVMTKRVAEEFCLRVLRGRSGRRHAQRGDVEEGAPRHPVSSAMMYRWQCGRRRCCPLPPASARRFPARSADTVSARRPVPRSLSAPCSSSSMAARQTVMFGMHIVRADFIGPVAAVSPDRSGIDQARREPGCAASHAARDI